MTDIDTRKITDYWSEQAKTYGSSPQANTPDYWLREIEYSNIVRILNELGGNANVLDIGCGNGYTTLRLHEAFPQHGFLGGDLSPEMIHVAQESLRALGSAASSNVRFEVIDVLDLKQYESSFDVVVSVRCLINLPSAELQWAALKQIWRALKKNGQCVLIENFQEPQDALNKVREGLGLPPIPIRWHNHFFSESELLAECEGLFEVAESVPITSTYYLITRVVYSKLCQLEGRVPDYDHPIYQIATKLPILGDLGPVRLLRLMKKDGTHASPT
jgi:ubiquinone/menaquinone biosynthesis C-methylase UbiE